MTTRQSWRETEKNVAHELIMTDSAVIGFS